MSETQRLSAAQVPRDFSPTEPHLIGVSGGRDSIALLHWLKSRGFSRLIVCHLDHQLREQSAEDARFTEKCARAWGFECVTHAVDLKELARSRKQSLETAAREIRYEFFARVAAARGCPRLFLAHHADDQVETFLLQLLRGAGAGGLGGMALVDPRTVGEVTLRVARPFLGVWRSEIDAYIGERGLAFRDDATNAELEYTRNRMRHLAIPALKEAFGRDPRAALWRAAELLREEDALLDSAPELQELPEQLDVGWLRALPLALQRRALHRWLQDRGVSEVGFEEVESTRRLLEMEVAKVNLPGDLCARRRERKIFVDFQRPA